MIQCCIYFKWIYSCKMHTVYCIMHNACSHMDADKYKCILCLLGWHFQSEKSSDTMTRGLRYDPFSFSKCVFINTGAPGWPLTLQTYSTIKYIRQVWNKIWLMRNFGKAFFKNFDYEKSDFLSNFSVFFHFWPEIEFLFVALKKKEVSL